MVVQSMLRWINVDIMIMQVHDFFLPCFGQVVNIVNKIV